MVSVRVKPSFWIKNVDKLMWFFLTLSKPPPPNNYFDQNDFIVFLGITAGHQEM